jgi:hypothetical protein
MHLSAPFIQRPVATLPGAPGLDFETGDTSNLNLHFSSTKNVPCPILSAFFAERVGNQKSKPVPVD